jgi:hypothetical protein
MAMAKPSKKQLIGMTGDVQIEAAAGEGKQPTFSVLAYTGGPMQLAYYDLPVVVDLAGMEFGRQLVANLDHDRTKRVGNVTGKAIADNQLTLSGVASAATAARDEVVASAKNGFIWQASIEAMPGEMTELAAGKTAEVNGRTVNGPAYIVRTSTLKGFAFVSHGADDNTTVSIAAGAAHSLKEMTMDKELKAWIESMGFAVDDLTPEQLAALKADYEGRKKKKDPPSVPSLTDGIEARRAEKERVDAITERALAACDARPYEIDKIKALAQEAIEGKWTVEKFRIELLEATVPLATGVPGAMRDRGLTPRVLEAAICQAGRLENVEKIFSDQELQAAHDRFRGAIGLKQIFLLGAEANGYRAPYSGDVTIEVQRAAFGMTGAREIRASGFSTLSIPNILSNVANKFLRDGWNAVDQTPLRVSTVRNVRDFKTITTVSLTGDLDFAKVGPDGEIKHGTLGEVAYTNKADTYARMLAITRTDIINDDLGALSRVPFKLGRGAMLKLNDIFWTEFLNNSSFFTSGRSNVNTGVADMTVGGLEATELIFMSQTDPDSKPLGVQPEILLVPTALKAAALTLMNSELLIDGSSTSKQGNANIWRNRFRVESSPYMHNSSYTGYSAAAWYMLADPAVLPVIEIVALNGRIEPIVETADADFNVLGVQMRGYSDVGVNMQEYRGGVRADGGSS